MFRVLIADDESIIRKGLCQIIDWEGLGYNIAGEAANGREALDFIERENPDVVLIDIKMPNLHGLEAIAKAREAGFTGRVIVLSGYSDFSYAQEAIKQGVTAYLTKPVDEDELEKTLISIREELTNEEEEKKHHNLYFSKAKEALMVDFLSGNATLPESSIKELKLESDIYRIIIYEKYSHNVSNMNYNFSELLQVANNNEMDYSLINIRGNHVVLLKGSHAVNKFDKIIDRFTNELPPEKNSPLDTIFITCGRKVENIQDLPQSFEDAYSLITKRFFCDQHQHVMIYEEYIDKETDDKASSADRLMEKYVSSIVNYIQAYNRNKIADVLRELEQDLYQADMSMEEEKNFLIDLYLQIKEKISYLYKTANIPFKANSEVINFIKQSYYLYEIIAFLSTQFEMIMSSIGYSSKDSIIDDIVHYIDHNYPENITLENIAPLFGYNSSYLGKIFSKKMGINFNAYLDNIRIEHSKELLKGNKTQVYKIAEMVGYRNVDYFHIKFKKSTGITPAEFRKQNK